MKKMFKISALTLSAVLIAPSATISASATDINLANVQSIYSNSNYAALVSDDCSALNSIDLKSLIEKCGTDTSDVQAIINKGTCNADDIKNLVSKGICSEDDLKSLIEKCGILPDNNQCITGGNMDETTSQPTQPATTPQATQPTPQPVTQPVTEPTVPETTEPNDGNTSEVSSYEKQVVELVNKERASKGLSPLTLNTELSRVARIKSEDMRDNGYFNHNSPTYGSPFDMMKSFGISYRTAGENIAMGQQSPEAVVTAWMNSDGHRANILNANFTQIGVGYAANGNYWTQMFIG